jgi:hypothetical protein
MSWTYDPFLLTTRDRIRLIIGDTDEADQLLSDEEIDASLTIYTDELVTAYMLVQALAARFARRADIAVTGLRENLSQLAMNYRCLAKDLEIRISQHDISQQISVLGIVEGQTTSAFVSAQFDNPVYSVSDEAMHVCDE